MLAGDPRVHGLDLRARHPLGVLHRLQDGALRLLDVGDDAFAKPRGARLPHPEDVHRGVLEVSDHLRDDGGGLGRPDVETGDEAIEIHGPSGSRATTWSRNRRSSSAAT